MSLQKEKELNNSREAETNKIYSENDDLIRTTKNVKSLILETQDTYDRYRNASVQGEFFNSELRDAEYKLNKYKKALSEKENELASKLNPIENKYHKEMMEINKTKHETNKNTQIITLSKSKEKLASEIYGLPLAVFNDISVKIFPDGTPVNFADINSLDRYLDITHQTKISIEPFANLINLARESDNKKSKEFIDKARNGLNINL
ncbi:hypothetical protein WFL09_13235 [Yersinia enterocolitica]